MPASSSPDAPVDAGALSKLRWRCRRGLLENDLFVERFFARFEPSITEAQAQGLLVLMDLSDNDLLDLLLSRKEPEGALLRDDVLLVLQQMRVPQSPPQGNAVPPHRAASTSVGEGPGAA